MCVKTKMRKKVLIVAPKPKEEGRNFKLKLWLEKHQCSYPRGCYQHREAARKSPGKKNTYRTRQEKLAIAHNLVVCGHFSHSLMFKQAQEIVFVFPVKNNRASIFSQFYVARAIINLSRFLQSTFLACKLCTAK